MPFSGCGPGKTSAKLLNDFLAFDPLKSIPSANYLTDVSIFTDHEYAIQPQRDRCKHEYTVKTHQSHPPERDTRPEQGTQFKLAVLCKKCRIHADIHIGFYTTVCACPVSDYPLHHFQRVPSEDVQLPDRLAYAWQCSHTNCGAQLKISFRQPVLKPAHRHLLTDTALLKKRYEEVVKSDPDRKDVRQATPTDAVNRLRRYIKDALDPDHKKRTVAANNKRFMEAFGLYGKDLEPLLKELGWLFTNEDDMTDPLWTLPNPPDVPDRLRADGTSFRERLEDVEMELRAWLYQVSAETGVENPVLGDGWRIADDELERCLGAQGYPRFSARIRQSQASSKTISYFSSLGALYDFSDELVDYAFDRQLACDPEQQPFYFDCLQQISRERNTESLQFKVATLESQGMISRSDILAAYKRLGLDSATVSNYSDQKILETFQAQVPDLGPHAQEDSRQALYKIGQSRGSSMLMNASRETIKTYEDALAWLGNGASRDIDDDALLAIAAAKLHETADNSQTVQKAISVIAQERKSNTLNGWLLTGRNDGSQMSVDEALRHLGISENLTAIDPNIFDSIFTSARLDRPGEQTEKAITVIQQAMANTTISHSPDTWPVGLTSHGNTCYLNSLLQYYFSIAPLRDVVLNYEKYKLDTSKYHQKNERVGQRKISMVEIEGGQRFAEDLKHLFEGMIKEPGKDVKPEEELVCRAFLEPKDYALLAPTTKEGKDEEQTRTLEKVLDEKPSDDPLADPRHASDASSITLHGDVDLTSEGATQLASPAAEAIDKKQQPVAAPPLPPRRFSVSRDEALKQAQANAKQQQDVTEVHDAVMFRLRSGMMPTGQDAREEQDDDLRKLFKIGLVDTMVKDGVDGEKTEMNDSSLQLDVPIETTDIYTALDAYFDLQAFQENSDHAEKFKSIRDLPQLLQINIPRINFDKDGRGTYKSEETLKLHDEIFLDRYMESSDSRVLPIRKKCWGWRKQLQALRKEQKSLSQSTLDQQVDGPTVVTETAQYLRQLSDADSELESLELGKIGIDLNLADVLAEDAKQQTQRLSDLESNIEDLESLLKGQFEDMKSMKYRLAAVFFHRGSYGHGHYWIYIHDFDKDIWRLYNDEKVEEFNKVDEILQATGWQQGTPTYAVYVKDSEKTKIIQPVCRAPEKIPTPDSSALPASAWVDDDVPMLDGEAQTGKHSPAMIHSVNPKDTMIDEGGESLWDKKRAVTAANW